MATTLFVMVLLRREVDWYDWMRKNMLHSVGYRESDLPSMRTLVVVRNAEGAQA